MQSVIISLLILLLGIAWWVRASISRSLMWPSTELFSLGITITSTGEDLYQFAGWHPNPFSG